MKKLNKFMALASTVIATGAILNAQSTINLSTLAVPAGGAQYTQGNLLNTVTTLTSNNTYILDTKIYVVDGQSLYIEPGTVIKATFGQGEDAPALIVSRGGKIYAEGTKDAPIIFTTIEDPLDGSYSAINKEKWGGIILLGKAYNNVLYNDQNPEAQPSAQIGIANGECYIEGLDYPDPRHHYGALTRTPNTVTGTPNFENDDNSGVLRYVSIRHGGSEIGVANEINGLTCGSVGSKTVLEHIEVVSNGDDGIEFFGGTVNIKYANIMFCEDDYIDTDQGYSGKGQFIYGVMLPATQGDSVIAMGDNGLEWDGNDYDNRTVVSNPQFTNVTIIGHAGSGDYGLELKEECAGTISNSIIAGFAIAGRHNNTPPTTTNVNNVLFLNSSSNGSLNSSYVVNSPFVTSTSIIDDILTINTTLSGGIWIQSVVDQLNPVPAAGTPEISTDFKPWETDDFFTYAPYKGAFEPGAEPWTQGWTLHTSMGTDISTVGCPTDIDKNGTTGVGDALLLNNEYGNSCY
ncbi:MAG: hypothetical protein JXB34_01370 [Bacteroidales bacterium]|nr:hypothetical protein [Bacteroidales bacterium]